MTDGPHAAPGTEASVQSTQGTSATKRVPTADELARMSPEELARLAAELDDVEIGANRKELRASAEARRPDP